MPCSRTPKWKLRPALLVAVNTPPPLISVLFEPVKSPDPPISSGSFGAMALIVFPDAARVA